MSGANVSGALSDMWRSVLLFVPTALAFVAILLIGYLLARLIRTVVERSLKRVGFDRAIERSGFGRALDGSPVTPGDLCAKIVFYGVMLFALQLAFGLWGPNAVSDLLTLVIAWLPRAFVAIVIVVVAVAIAGAARDLICSALGGLAYGALLARVTSAFIIGLGLIAALEQVGIATAVTGPLLIAVLATVSGVIIVGVGGGLVRPMQRRWEVWLDRAGTESQVIREHARTYTQNRAAAAAARGEAPRADPAWPASPGVDVPGGEAQATGQVWAGVVESESERTQVISVQPIAVDPDRTRDVPSSDGPLPDGPLPDGPLPDGPLPDGPLPDGPLSAVPEQPVVSSAEQTQVIRPPRPSDD